MKHSTLLSIAAITLCALSGLVVPAQAATIPITYSYAGTATGNEIFSGTILTADHLLSGSILSGDSALNAALNPVTGQDHDTIDLTTGILNGSVTFNFGNGEALFGTQHVEGLSASSQIQTLTFTGGTGEFAGATGSASGAASLTSSGYMVSGNGVILSATPEPASLALFFAGFVILIVKWRRITARTAANESRR
jgi:hypothetical protein